MSGSVFHNLDDTQPTQLPKNTANFSLLSSWLARYKITVKVYFTQEFTVYQLVSILISAVIRRRFTIFNDWQQNQKYRTWSHVQPPSPKRRCARHLLRALDAPHRTRTTAHHLPTRRLLTLPTPASSHEPSTCNRAHGSSLASRLAPVTVDRRVPRPPLSSQARSPHDARTRCRCSTCSASVSGVVVAHGGANARDWHSQRS